MCPWSQDETLGRATEGHVKLKLVLTFQEMTLLALSHHPRGVCSSTEE